jgi:hypothetical protein
MKHITKNNIYILKLLMKAAPAYLVVTCLSGAFLAAMQAASNSPMSSWRITLSAI